MNASGSYTGKVKIDRTAWVGFGSVGEGSTGKYHVTFTDQEGRSVDVDGYCVEPRWPGPDSTFSNASITEYSDSKLLAKIVYYGTSMSRDDCFFKQSGHTGFTANEQYGIP